MNSMNEKIKKNKNYLGDNKMVDEEIKYTYNKFGELLYRISQNKRGKQVYKNGKPTTSFLRDVKAGYVLTFPLEFDFILNEETGRFIKASKIFDKRAKGKVLKKKYKQYETKKGILKIKEQAFAKEIWDREVAKLLKKKNIANNKAFKFKIKSALVKGLEREFKFNDTKHFANWFEGIMMNDGKSRNNYDGTIQSHTVSQNAMSKNDRDVFGSSYLSVNKITGGYRNQEEKKNVKVKGDWYEFNCINPKSNYNNCGLECLIKLGVNLSSCTKVRELFKLPSGEISANDLGKIYKHYTESNDKILSIIDTTFSSHVMENYYYILIHKDHYMIVDNFTKNDKSKRVQRGLITFDFETRKKEKYDMVGDNKSYYIQDTICSMTVNKIRSKELCTSTLVSNKDKSSARQFIDFLINEHKQNKHYTCIAHNGAKFDFYFIMMNLTESEMLHTDIKVRGTSIIDIQFLGHVFRDSCCFMTDSLDNLCKAFKIKEAKLKSFEYQGKELTNMELCFYKPELTFEQFMNLEKIEPDFWKLYVQYCESDTTSLYHIWTKFKHETTSIIGKMGGYLLKTCSLNSATTIGGLSMKIVKAIHKQDKFHNMKNLTKFYDTKPYTQSGLAVGDGPQSDLTPYDFICKFKRGGISHCNMPGKHTQSVSSFDITSQYPTAMMHMKIPSGKSFWTHTYDKNNHGFYHLTDMEFQTDYDFKPVCGLMSGGSLKWDNKSISEAYVDSEMVKYLIEHYGLKSFNVKVGLVSKSYLNSKQLFGTYVDVLFKSKAEQDMFKETKDEKYNAALRSVIKLFLNSLTGKLVEDPSKYFQIEYKNKSDDDKQKDLVNNVAFNKKTDDDVQNLYVIAGVMVYSYSKRLLFEYIRCLPNDSNDIIHVETDSIYFHTKHTKKFIENVDNYDGDYPVIISDCLGSVKAEHVSQGDSYFLGKKFYHLDCINNGKVFKVKGIPKSTIDEKGSKVVLVDEELYKTVYSGKNVVKEFAVLNKNFYGVMKITAHRQTRTINSHPELYKEY